MKAAANLPKYAEPPPKTENCKEGGTRIVPGDAQPPLFSERSNSCGGQAGDLERVYEQLGVVGRGATSTIYLVRRLSDSKLLALKDTFLDLFSPRERAMTVNEIAIMRVG